MAYTVRDDHPDCDGFAVVADDAVDTVISCHPDEVAAWQAIAALLEAEAAEDEGEGDDEAAAGARVAWRGVLAMAATRTQDDRAYAELTVRTGELPLAIQDDAQHTWDAEGGEVGGFIERTLQVGNVILGFGTFDNTPAGQRGAQLAEHRFGCSVDLADIDADVTVECTAEGEVYDPWYDETFTTCVDNLWVFPHARIAGATMTPIPAFEEAWIELASASDLDDDAWAQQVAAEAQALADQRAAERTARLEDRGHTLVASAVPQLPPLAWFETPEPDQPQPLRITDDGRISGHLALWGECHVGLPGCVQPEPSPSGYAMFHRRESARAMGPDGAEVRVDAGLLTFRTSHADERASARTATAHYDNTGSQAGDIRVTDGALGIWCAGALRSGLDDAAMRELIAAAPSGDWRGIGPDLELVNVLMVNTPGFMGPHRSGARAVTAGGALQPDGTVHGGRVRTLLRLGFGYPRRERQEGELVRALRAEMLALRARVDTMWEGGGREAAFASLAASVESGDQAPAPARNSARTRGKSGGCGGTCGAKAGAKAGSCSCQH